MRAKRRKGPDRQGAWGSGGKSGSAPTKSLKHPQKQKDPTEVTYMSLIGLLSIILNIISAILLAHNAKCYKKLIEEIENDRA